MLSLRLKPTDSLALIYAQRASLLKELHGLHERRSLAKPESELAQILLLDLGGMRLEAELKWLEIVESRLDEIRKQPPPAAQNRPRGRPRKGA
jgi:hypothetical protein